MGAREAASAAEILDVLKKVIPKGRALPFYFAAKSISRELRTTSATAFTWLNLAVQEEPHEFELLGTSSGYAWHVARGDGTFLRLDEAGYTDTADVSYWPLMTAKGEFVSKDGDADNHEFLVLSDTLRMACERSRSFTKKSEEARERVREASIRGAEERHGKSLAYFRGMLRMAGIEVGPSNFRAGLSRSIAGDSASMIITLHDGAIDRVAELLAANGIEPEPPTQIVTRRPLPEATE